MEIQRRKIRVNEEKNILTGTIISEKFLLEMHSVLKEVYHAFKSPSIKVILSWILDYYEEFDEPPYSSIQDIFNAKAETIQKEDMVEIIEETLIDISEKYEDSSEEFNAEYHIKQAIQYCKKISVVDFASRVKGYAEGGDVERAEHEIGKYTRIDNSTTTGLDLLNASEYRKEVYSPENNNTVHIFSGAFGQLMGPLERGGLYLVASNSKRGKSFACIDMARELVMAGLNVHYFSLEMNKSKILTRWDMNLAKSLIYVNDLDQSIDDEYETIKKGNTRSKTVHIPYFDTDKSIQYQTCEVSTITAEKGDKAEKLFKRQYRNGGKLTVFDITTSGNTLNSIVKTEENEERYNNNISDVIIIDSIYLCADGKGEKEYQRYSNLHWRSKQLLGEKMSKCVISPYQFSKSALQSGDGNETNLANSYEVFAHCSATVFLNASDDELEKGVIRAKASGRDWNYNGEVIICRCLDIARGIISSEWRKNIPNYNEFIKGDLEEMTADDENELQGLSLDEV